MVDGLAPPRTTALPNPQPRPRTKKSGERDAAQVPRDSPLLRDGGPVLPQLLHLLLPVGAVHGGRIQPAVRLQGLEEAP